MGPVCEAGWVGGGGWAGGRGGSIRKVSRDLISERSFMCFRLLINLAFIKVSDLRWNGSDTTQPRKLFGDYADN